MTEFVRIFEMAPRDGLQNEKRVIPLADKIRLVNLLSECGFSHIETASFVSARWVPQMADSAEVLAGIKRWPEVAYTALTPNMRGYENARRAVVDEVAVFGSASEGFCQANINCSIAESFERFAPVLKAAREDGIRVRGYVSCIVDCPYDGPTSPEAVRRVATEMLEMGCYQISLGDTIGSGTPERIGTMLQHVLRDIPADRLAGHFHDTNGRAVENIEAALGLGLRVFDAAIGGLGGCPYAPGAKGNVDTMKVMMRLHELGYETGLNREKLQVAADFAQDLRS
ncbi:MAG: hydroxymethylglutaryl-CoA lyase [Rhodobacteraceae bacterium]|nr:hydroxymethylglutaryl-CoA lyase [Paracoccaceae bacterium]